MRTKLEAKIKLLRDLEKVFRANGIEKIFPEINASGVQRQITFLGKNGLDLEIMLRYEELTLDVITEYREDLQKEQENE